MIKSKKVVYAFIDAANLFYGGEKSLGWSVDYQLLRKYLKNKFSVSKVFYYAGIDIEQYKSRGKEIDPEGVIAYFRS